MQKLYISGKIEMLYINYGVLVLVEMKCHHRDDGLFTFAFSQIHLESRAFLISPHHHWKLW